MAGDIRQDFKVNRNRVENSQAELIAAQVDLEEVNLRIRLAIKRSQAVGDVLEPALVRMQAISESVQSVRHELSALWSEGQAVRWDIEQQQLNSLCSHIQGGGLGADVLPRNGNGRDHPRVA